MCQSIGTIRDLLACHDSDTRYDELPCRSAVAALYLPLIGVVIGALQQLHGYSNDDNSSFTPDVAMAIATSSVSTFMSPDEGKTDLPSQVCSLRLLLLDLRFLIHVYYLISLLFFT